MVHLETSTVMPHAQLHVSLAKGSDVYEIKTQTHISTFNVCVEMQKLLRIPEMHRSNCQGWQSEGSLHDAFID